MSTKGNLSAFRSVTPAATVTEPPPTPGKKSEIVGVTLRLTPDQWRRAKELAIADRTSIQALAVAGISRLLTDRGLPPL
jgi:hypothetical protein